LAPVSRCARLEDRLQLDGRSNAEIAERYYAGSSARHQLADGYCKNSRACGKSF